MCRLFATEHRTRAFVGSLALLVLTYCLSLNAAPRVLFLLTGTFLNDAGQTFPVRLYTVDANHNLKLFRGVVPGDQGIHEVLDDTIDNIYVSFPYDNGVSEAPTFISVIHKQHPTQQDVVPFNPKKDLVWDRATATAVGLTLKSYGLFTLFPISHVDQHAAFMQLVRSTATTLAAVAGDPVAGHARATQNDWSLYRSLTFFGSPGGPGIYSAPETVIQNGNLIMQLGGESVHIDSAPPVLASASDPGTIWILAANRRFVVSIPLNDAGGNYTAPATMYVHDRLLDAWKTLKSPGSMPQCKIFGDWLATRVRGVRGGAVNAPDTNPGHEDESHQWVRYERPDVRGEFGSIDQPFDIPGIALSTIY